MISDESLVDSTIDDGNFNLGGTKSKPLTLQEVRKLKSNTLIESIGELLEAKTSLMISEIKLNIATNAKDLKVDMNKKQFKIG